MPFDGLRENPPPQNSANFYRRTVPNPGLPTRARAALPPDRLQRLYRESKARASVASAPQSAFRPTVVQLARLRDRHRIHGRGKNHIDPQWLRYTRSNVHWVGSCRMRCQCGLHRECRSPSPNPYEATRSARFAEVRADATFPRWLVLAAATTQGWMGTAAATAGIASHTSFAAAGRSSKVPASSRAQGRASTGPSAVSHPGNPSTRRCG